MISKILYPLCLIWVAWLFFNSWVYADLSGMVGGLWSLAVFRFLLTLALCWLAWRIFKKDFLFMFNKRLAFNDGVSWVVCLAVAALVIWQSGVFTVDLLPHPWNSWAAIKEGARYLFLAPAIVAGLWWLVCFIDGFLIGHQPKFHSPEIHKASDKLKKWHDKLWLFETHPELYAFRERAIAKAENEPGADEKKSVVRGNVIEARSIALIEGGETEGAESEAETLIEGETALAPVGAQADGKYIPYPVGSRGWWRNVLEHGRGHFFDEAVNYQPIAGLPKKYHYEPSPYASEKVHLRYWRKLAAAFVCVFSRDYLNLCALKEKEDAKLWDGFGRCHFLPRFWDTVEVFFLALLFVRICIHGLPGLPPPVFGVAPAPLLDGTSLAAPFLLIASTFWVPAAHRKITQWLRGQNWYVYVFRNRRQGNLPAPLPMPFGESNPVAVSELGGLR